ASCRYEKTVHTANICRLSHWLSDPRANRSGPEPRRRREGDSFGATAKTYAATRGRGPANPQGRGSQIRGNQERPFAFRNAEDETTLCPAQRKRAAVAENSHSRAVPTTAGHPRAGHQEGNREEARRRIAV